MVANWSRTHPACALREREEESFETWRCKPQWLSALLLHGPRSYRIETVLGWHGRLHTMLMAVCRATNHGSISLNKVLHSALCNSELLHKSHNPQHGRPKLPLYLYGILLTDAGPPSVLAVNCQPHCYCSGACRRWGHNHRPSSRHKSAGSDLSTARYHCSTQYY